MVRMRRRNRAVRKVFRWTCEGVIELELFGFREMGNEVPSFYKVKYSRRPGRYI